MVIIEKWSSRGRGGGDHKTRAIGASGGGVAQEIGKKVQI